MAFIIMHKTNAHWESGALPTAPLIARVGSLFGELESAGVLGGGEGLRASSQGVRLRFSGGARTVIEGPFTGSNELPAGFTIIHADSLDEAVKWATRQAEVLGDVEIDIRPVTEPWDIGLASKPDDVTTVRYMILRKATTETEAGSSPTTTERASLAQLLHEITRTGLPTATATIRSSSRGRRYKNTRNGVTVMDGPFVETKELLAGYVIISSDSLNEACQWAVRYLNAVGASEVDVLELE